MNIVQYDLVDVNVDIVFGSDSTLRFLCNVS